MRPVNNFLGQVIGNASESQETHHEQIPSVQKKLLSHVQSVTDVILDIGNPFSEISTDLYTLDTNVIMGECVVKTIRTANDVGIAQYQRFVSERVSDKTTDFNNTIRKNNLQLFNNSSSKTADRSTSRVACLKTDVQLFSKMYISCQLRESAMVGFFYARIPRMASFISIN